MRLQRNQYGIRLFKRGIVDIGYNQCGLCLDIPALGYISIDIHHLTVIGPHNHDGQVTGSSWQLVR